MKLIRLKLNDSFRSLPEGFEVTFLPSDEIERAYDFAPYCLAGPNGSGKSNILEALASIFYHIDCMHLVYIPDNFACDEDNKDDKRFSSKISKPDAYELEYFITSPQDNSKLTHVVIEKSINSAPTIYIYNKENDIKEKVEEAIKKKELLPKYIIGYSSGENEILSLPFYKMRFVHFDEYKEKLTKELPYTGSPEGRLIYLDNQYYQAILLCNFLMQPLDMLEAFNEVVGFRSIKQFRVVIRQHFELDYHKEYLDELSPKDREIKDVEKIEFTRNIKDKIDNLKRCSTTHYYDPETESLYLDFWVNEVTREAFQFQYQTPLQLFQDLQVLLTLNLINIDEGIKSGVYNTESLYLNDKLAVPITNELVMRFNDYLIEKEGAGEIQSRSLSDGEHQFLHTIGLCLLFKDEPALFLLDEPETHLNPEWRANYISILKKSLETGSKEGEIKVTRDLLITSHSPFIISDSKRENVLVFSKEDDKVICKRPNFNTFGASANKITIRMFKRKKTIGNYSNSFLDEFKERVRNGENREEILNEALSTLGDSIDMTLFIDYLFNDKGEN